LNVSVRAPGRPKDIVVTLERLSRWSRWNGAS
jgi:hypothetical protein